MFPPSCTQTNIHTFAPHVDTQKWTRYPHSHSPYALYTPRSRHHHPQRGSQRPIPELNPLRSALGQEDHPGPRSSRENQQPRPRPGGQFILTAPGPRQRTENRGVRKKKNFFFLTNDTQMFPNVSVSPTNSWVGKMCFSSRAAYWRNLGFD